MKAVLPLIVLAAICHGENATQKSADPATWLAFIGTELRYMRVELLEARVEGLNERLRALSREQESIALERTRLEAEEQSQRAQAALMDKHAAEPNLDATSREQLEAAKSEITGAAIERARGALRKLASREAEINEQIRATRAQSQSLSSKLTQLTTAAH